MSVTDQMRRHQERCVPHLARLSMLASEHAGPPAAAAAEVARATGAILAEAEAAQRSMAVTGSRQAGNRSLLASRLARLSAAAKDTLTAARDGNAVALRQNLRRFDSLTSAMWTVQLSVCGTAPRSRPRVDLS